MNNGYSFNFNPSFMRNVTPFQITPYQKIPTTIPRMNSLFGNTKSFVNTNTSKITFSSILNGASKTLGVINQAIPVFYQVKPIWNNARTMIKVVKGLNSKESSPINTTNTTTNEKRSDKNNIKTNAPTFFM